MILHFIGALENPNNFLMVKLQILTFVGGDNFREESFLSLLFISQPVAR
jgi:transcriptional antiterminator